jgi:hypothetical protein
MSMRLIVRLVFWFWLLAALYVGDSLLLQRLPMPAIPGLILLLTAGVLLLYGKNRRWHDWINSLDLRSLVLLHVTRFVGFYFLVLYQRGELPYAFAVPGGWGDNLTAALALLICFLPLRPALRRRAITMWNALGFVDIMLVVFTAARLGLQDPAQMRALTYLPLSLLPTFLVPLIIATHVIIYLRLRREAPGA